MGSHRRILFLETYRCYDLDAKMSQSQRIKKQKQKKKGKIQMTGVRMQGIITVICGELFVHLWPPSSCQHGASSADHTSMMGWSPSGLPGGQSQTFCPSTPLSPLPSSATLSSVAPTPNYRHVSSVQSTSIFSFSTDWPLNCSCSFIQQMTRKVCNVSRIENRGGEAAAWLGGRGDRRSGFVCVCVRVCARTKHLWL